jgi:hypothetical protein
MTNRIPPQPIGSKIETFYPNMYNFSRNNGKVKLENCEASYRTRSAGVRNSILENKYTDKDGNLSVDEATTIVQHLDNEEIFILKEMQQRDEGFDGIPDDRIYTEGSLKDMDYDSKRFDEKAGFAGEFK